MRLTITLVLTLFLETLFAQQLPLFTQYRENIGLINPAALTPDYVMYDGEQKLSIGLSSRLQWIGDVAGPETHLIRGAYVLANNQSSFGLQIGGQLLQDQFGPTVTTGAIGRFSAFLRSARSGFGGLALGFSFGAINYKIKTSEIALLDEDDPLSADQLNHVFPDVGVGLYYFKELSGGVFDNDIVFAGISMPQLLGANVDQQISNSEFTLERVRHTYFNLGLYKRLNAANWLEISSWIKYVEAAPVNADINLRYQHRRSFWVGLGGSSAGNLHFEAGVFVLGSQLTFGEKLLKIGYGFDYGIGQELQNFGTTHEFNLTFAL